MLQATNVALQATLVLVFQYKFSCGLLERPGRPDAVHERLAGLFGEPS